MRDARRRSAVAVVHFRRSLKAFVIRAPRLGTEAATCLFGLQTRRRPCHAKRMSAEAASSDPTLGMAIDRLAETVALRAAHTEDTSYTAKLLAKGVPTCAQKLGEEAVELAIAAVTLDRDEVRKEAADLLYHLTVLLYAAGVHPSEVAAELSAREGVSGLVEKASRRADVS